MQLICGLAIALVALAGCKSAVDEPNNNTAAGFGGSLPAGMGGIAPAGAGGVGGVLAGGAGGIGGTPVGGGGGVGGTPPVGGSAGSTMPAGAGGMAGGAGAAGSQAGAGGMGGAAGSAGAAGAEMPGPGEVPSAQCLADVMAAGTTITGCEMCLCQVGKCQKELMALKGDTNGNALVKCSQTKKCSGQCCVCNAECDALGGNYGMGPCINEIETAAGVTPGAGALTNGGTVMTNCAATGPDGNSCARAVRLGECTAMHCMTECMTPTCM